MELNNYVQSKEADLTIVSSFRMFTEPDIARKYEYRNDADIDYARVIYSSSFRRLQGKMQLFIPDNINFHRNRLTHSMEVSQISRSIAKKLKLSDITTVRTCSLAHDLGNPPFGHAGEVVINKLSSTSIYEGNAQTFRILNHLEEKHHLYNGLNLTLRTLLGVVKYPFKRSDNPEKFLYDEDYELLKEYDRGITLKTIDCEIMDIADEIAYAAHDLEDALRLKYFTIDDILYEFHVSEYAEAAEILNNEVIASKEFGRKANTYKTSEEYSTLFIKELTSRLVDLLINDIGLVVAQDTQKIGFLTKGKLAKGLKKLTFNSIKRSTSIYRYELLGEKVIRGLYEVYMDSNFNKDLKLLPAEYRLSPAERETEKKKERTILDYIGGMMDNYAIMQYGLYYGENEVKNLYKRHTNREELL